MSSILERALDLALDRKDPGRRLERRRKRQQARREKAEDHPDPGNHSENHSESPPTHRPTDVAGAGATAPSRHVAVGSSDVTLEHAGYQCEYRGPDGRQCTARTHLEIDHIDPFARSADNTEANLRVLCRAHNRYRAEQELGAAFIEKKIAEGRARDARQAVPPRHSRDPELPTAAPHAHG